MKSHGFNILVTDNIQNQENLKYLPMWTSEYNNKFDSIT